MKKNNKKKIEEFIRVDHAGERGAIKIYEGQILALSTVVKDNELKKTVEEMMEHEKEHAGIEALQRDYGALLAAIQGWKPTPQIICTGVWNPYKAGERTAYTAWSRQVEDTMKGICNAKGIPFASVEQVALDPACSGSGTSSGVRWHPNDAGMAGYAQAILQLLTSPD